VSFFAARIHRRDAEASKAAQRRIEIKALPPQQLRVSSVVQVNIKLFARPTSVGETYALEEILKQNRPKEQSI